MTKKLLFIELKKKIKPLIDEYMKASGIDGGDMAFALGYLSNAFKNDQTGNEQFKFINQIYFFTGVFYSKTTDDFLFEKLSLEEKKKLMEKLNKETFQTLKNLKIKNKNILNYLG